MKRQLYTTIESYFDELQKMIQSLQEEIKVIQEFMKDFKISDFPHDAPEGYSYEFEEFNTRLVVIWLRHHYPYSFAQGETVRTIWGFYSPKKREYFAPINSSKCGDKVDIKNTRNYTAMQIKQTPLEACFQ